MNWWLRSVNATNTTNFCNVNTNGNANNNNASYSFGFAPGFEEMHGLAQVARVKVMPFFKGGFGPWRMAFRASESFMPKMARRYGHADAACMAGKFIGVLARFMDDHYADIEIDPKSRKAQEVMHLANHLPEGILHAEETHSI